jgi:hypothetical protein
MDTLTKWSATVATRAKPTHVQAIRQACAEGTLASRAINLPQTLGAGAPFETLNQPAARRPRRSLLAIYRVHRHEQVRGARHLDPDGAQPVARDVIFHHEHGHVAEAEAGAQKGVLRAHVGEPPACRFTIYPRKS